MSDLTTITDEGRERARAMAKSSQDTSTDENRLSRRLELLARELESGEESLRKLRSLTAQIGTGHGGTDPASSARTHSEVPAPARAVAEAQALVQRYQSAERAAKRARAREADEARRPVVEVTAEAPPVPAPKPRPHPVAQSPRPKLRPLFVLVVVAGVIIVLIAAFLLLL